MYRAKRLLLSGVVSHDLMVDIHWQFKACESINNDILKHCYLFTNIVLIDRKRPDKLIKNSRWCKLVYFEGLLFLIRL